MCSGDKAPKPLTWTWTGPQSKEEFYRELVFSEGHFKDQESLDEAFYNYQQKEATATKTSILSDLHDGNLTKEAKIDVAVGEIVEYDAGVEDDDGPNNNPVAKAADPFPFRSADAWHMVHRHPAELDLAGLLSKGSPQ